jgi:hypothetical protein
MLKKHGILDGFDYCFNMHESIFGSFQSYVMEQLFAIRQAKTYRPQWIRLPEDTNPQIPAYGSYEYQMHLKPGSWIYALQFLDYDSFGNEATSNGRMSLQITETYSGMPLLSEFEDVNLCRASKVENGFAPRLAFLTSPIVIPAPGDVDVEVCNLTGQPITWQLTVFTVEPYEAIEQ